LDAAVKEPYLLQMPRSRAPPADYVLEGSTKDLNRYSTPDLRVLAKEFNEASQILEQVTR
jgi:hypothetical protein